MTYKECIIEATDELAKNPKTIFLGYNVKKGRANGTLKNVPEEQLFETPVAENLMIGLAIGLSLEGYLPVVYIERFDFILNGLDAIINHLMKIGEMSNGQFQPAIILKVAIGFKNKPPYACATHIQDFTRSMETLLSFPVVKLKQESSHIISAFQLAEKQARFYTQSIMLIEEKELYDEIV